MHDIPIPIPDKRPGNYDFWKGWEKEAAQKSSSTSLQPPCPAQTYPKFSLGEKEPHSAQVTLPAGCHGLNRGRDEGKSKLNGK